jgi:PPOX class probable F420-dependent enzyme
MMGKVADGGSDDPSWADVARYLAAARSYWLGTTGPNGSPHVAPVWGVVIDGALFLYSERSTAKARNLARDSRAVIHLESAEDVLIVYGTLQDIGGPDEAEGFVAALADKYREPEDRRYLPSADEAFDVVYRMRPQKALMWILPDFEGTQRRWIAPTDVQPEPVVRS